MIEGIKLGTGILTWNVVERVQDRYGYVYLLSNLSSCREAPISSMAQILRGQIGTLSVRIIGTRESTHTGDAFRKIYPRTPSVNDKIILGHGMLRYGNGDPRDGYGVGVQPPSKAVWMSVRALYDAHHQTVDLYFTPDAMTN